MINISGEETDARVFVSESQLDSDTHSQLYSVVSHPAFTNEIAVMPDCHAGRGVVIGFTMELTEKVVPQVIGTDIGCGMHAWKLGSELPRDTETLKQDLEDTIPGQATDNTDTVGSLDQYPFDEAMSLFREFSRSYADSFDERVSPPFEFREYDTEYLTGLCDRVGISPSILLRDVGTLGGGNHFAEIGQSVKTDDYWLVVHTGSRRFGKTVAKHWIEKTCDHPVMGWLDKVDGFGYLTDMLCCQVYARWNRERMGERFLERVGITPETEFDSTHNYIDFRDLIIRKGATRAHEGDQIVVPLNAGDGILLCEGSGNPDANRSAPHGAGRVLSRGEAKQLLDKETVDETLSNVETATDVPLSEAPQSYKDPDELLENITPLADVTDHLEPVVNLKHH